MVVFCRLLLWPMNVAASDDVWFAVCGFLVYILLYYERSVCFTTCNFHSIFNGFGSGRLSGFLATNEKFVRSLCAIIPGDCIFTLDSLLSLSDVFNFRN